MKIRNIGSNMTEVEGATAKMLISYETPVAAKMHNGPYYRTAKKHSVTTSRHINKWLDGARAEVKPQEFFDNLL